MKEIIIIGSGIGGLAAGAKLSKNGHKVTIIEKHFIPGGYATNFVRKAKTGEKFLFDVSLHGIGDLSKGRHFYKELDELGVFNKIKPLRKSETATLILGDGTLFDIPDDFELYKKVLIEKFPNEKNGIEDLFDFLKDFDDDMENNMNGPNGGVPKYIQQLQDITLYDFLKRYVDNDEFINLFCFLWLYYGLPAKEINAYYYLVAWLGYHIGGTYYMEGGAGAFSKALADIIEENNGKIILKEEVIKINTNNDKIVSVETNKGNIYIGDIFILNGCPENVLTNIDNYALVEDYLKDVKSRKESVSLTQLYIGVDQNPANLGVTKADIFYDNGESSQKGYEYILNNDYNNTHFGLVNYNLLDPNLNKDTGFLCITIGDLEKNWPERGTSEYKDKKNEVTNILLNRLYDLYPDLQGHILLTELGTPRTMKRYTNNRNGAVYGFAQDLNNGGFNRTPFKTCISNTYIAGAWTTPGGGYQGAILSGIMCSNLILNSFKKNINQDNKQEELMNPDTFMKGMVAGANKKYIKNLKLNYKFNFKDVEKQYFIKVDSGKVNIVDNLDSIDVEIICTYETWVLISTKKLDGSMAFREGSLKIKGDMETFMHIPNIFGSKEEEVAKPRKLFKGELFIPIFLAPWIVYWILSNFYKTELIGYFAIIYTLLVGYFVKPKIAKEITTLEYTTIFSFAIYNIIIGYTESNNYIYFELILPIALMLSCLKEPMTAQFSKWAYPDNMVKTSLFKDINVKITMVWALVFIVQFVIVKILFAGNPIGNIAYILNVVGIAFSIIYSKKAI